jgi:anti-anti-sigma factor
VYTFSLDGHGPAALHLTPQPRTDGLVVQVGGELDIATAGRLVEFVRTLSADECAHVRLDLTGLGFVDASGFSALVQADTVVRSRNGRLTISGVRPFPRRLMEILELPVTLEADGPWLTPAPADQPSPRRPSAQSRPGARTT